MTRKPDPLHNLADALSEDIVATPADALLHDAAGEPGGGAGPVASFDRIAVRAAAQSRRRRQDRADEDRAALRQEDAV